MKKETKSREDGETHPKKSSFRKARFKHTQPTVGFHYYGFGNIFSINHFPRFKCKNGFAIMLFLKNLLVGLPPPPTLCVALRALSTVHTHTN